MSQEPQSPQAQLKHLRTELEELQTALLALPTLGSLRLEEKKLGKELIGLGAEATEADDEEGMAVKIKDLQEALTTVASQKEAKINLLKKITEIRKKHHSIWEESVTKKGEKKEEEKEEEKEALPGRFHPLLPTAEEAQANPAEIVADHVFQRVQCGAHAFLIANITRPGFGFGFYPYVEKQQEDQDARETRLLFDLVEIAKTGIHVISTQEHWLPDTSSLELIARLEAETGEQWELILDASHTKGCLINTTKMGPVQREETAQLSTFMEEQWKTFDAEIRDKVLVDKWRLPQLVVFSDCILINMHLNHREIPDLPTAFIQKYADLLSKKTKKPVYMIGDINNRVLHTKRAQNKEFGVTNVVSAQFFGQQEADYTHCALLHHDGRFTQLHPQVVDTKTGAVYVAERPQNLTPKQKAILKRFKQAFTLGAEQYLDKIAVLGDLNLHACNQVLATYFGQDVRVDFALNAYSELGLVLNPNLPSEIAEKLTSIVKERAGVAYPLQARKFTPENVGEVQTQFAIPLAYAGTLFGILMDVYETAYKPRVNAEIAAQNKQSGFFGSKIPSRPHYVPQVKEILPAYVTQFAEFFRKIPSNNLTPHMLDTLRDKKVYFLEDGPHTSVFVSAYKKLLAAEYYLRQHEFAMTEIPPTKQPQAKLLRESHIQYAIKNLKEAHTSLLDNENVFSPVEAQYMRDQIMQLQSIVQPCVEDMQSIAERSARVVCPADLEEELAVTKDNIEGKLHQLRALMHIVTKSLDPAQKAHVAAQPK